MGYSVYSYKELDKEVLELYVNFWEYREKLSFGISKVNALSSIAVYSSVLKDEEKMKNAMDKLERLGYDSKKCFNLKDKDLLEREQNTERSNVAFEYGDIYAIDLHEAGFKLALLYGVGDEIDYPFEPFNIRDGNGNYILFNDIEYDSEIGETQWLKIPFSDVVEYWKAEKAKWENGFF